jgi:putative acetyltransferase
MARLREASGAADFGLVRELFTEYARLVDEPCCFAGFEQELAALAERYAVLLLAEADAVAIGCVGVRSVDPRTAEMKRLYVRAAHRGRGIGRRLAETAIAVARSRGFERMVLDSLPKMHEALALYRSLDFREIAPYLPEPTPGARCFELRL